MNKKILNIGLFYKVGIILLPLIVLLIFSFIAKEMQLFTNFFDGITKIKPVFLFNSFLVFIAFIIFFLCGLRFYVILKKLLHYSEKELNPLEIILFSFILGSFIAYALIMTIGVFGYYYRFVLWILVLLFLLFPVGLKSFFINIKNFISSIRKVKIKTDTATLLVIMVVLYLGLPNLLVQFNSPFPPTMDAMEVYISPITRVLTFHQYLPEDGIPTALYNEYRAVPLHTAFYSFLATLTGLNAYETQAGSFIFILLLALGTTYYFSHFLGGKLAGGLSLWLLTASCNFGHFTDGRSGVYCMFYFLPGFAFYIRMMLEKDKTNGLFYAIMAGISFGNVLQMHPVVGAYVILCLFLLFLFSKIWISFNAAWEGCYTLIIASAISSLLLFQFRNIFSLSTIHILIILSGGGLLIVVVLLLLRFVFKNDTAIPNYPLDGKRRCFPGLLLLVVIHFIYIFQWNILSRHEPPFLYLFRLSPLLFFLGIFAVLRMAHIFQFRKSFPVSEYKLGIIILLVAGGLISFSLPMYILPLFKLEMIQNMSFAMELPVKGLEFFILPLFVVLSSQVIVRIKKRIIRYSFIPLIIILVTLPCPKILGSFIDYFAESFQTSVQQVTEGQTNVAANGYFKYWDGDERIPVSKENLLLMDHIKNLIAAGEITIHDTIIYIATSDESWKALPFPIFTGVKETLLLLQRYPDSIHTFWGSIYDFPADFDYNAPPKWLLIDLMVQYHTYEYFSIFLKDNYQKSFENGRVILFKKAV